MPGFFILAPPGSPTFYLNIWRENVNLLTKSWIGFSAANARLFHFSPPLEVRRFTWTYEGKTSIFSQSPEMDSQQRMPGFFI